MSSLAFFGLMFAPLAITLIRYYLAQRLERRKRVGIEDPDLVDEGRVSDTGKVP